VILQQPSETHLRLDATTDKTAISSFVIATIIALALAGLATWLAYWYGRKSFDLTKQSFDAVMAQIKSSEQLMLESNINFINKQNDLKLKEIELIYNQKWVEDSREFAAIYLSNLQIIMDEFNFALHMIGIDKFSKLNLDHDKRESKSYGKLDDLYKNPQSNSVKLKLFFDYRNDKNHQILSSEKTVMLMLVRQFQYLFINDQIKFERELSNLGQCIEKLQQEILNIILEKDMGGK